MSSAQIADLTSPPFCGNPECVLHIRPGDAGVAGEGNWATVDGHTVSRGRYGSKMYCDPCGSKWIRNELPD